MSALPKSTRLKTCNRRSLAVAVGALLSVSMVVEAVQAQTRPTRAIGYSAAERDRVDRLLTKTRAQRDAYADRVGVSRRLMRSLAQEIGLANPKFSDQQFFEAVEAMAERALTLEDDNKRLRQELQRVSDPEFRSEASTLAEQAQLALDEGRLMDAELLFGRLRQLRWEQESAAQEALNSIVEAEARTAELRQDFDRARDLRLEAAQRELKALDQSRIRAFALASAAARGKAEEGQTFGRRDATENAIEIWQHRVLPVVPKSDFPELWASAQNELGSALGLQGERTEGAVGNRLLAEAANAQQAALTVFNQQEHPARWAQTKEDLGFVVLAQSNRQTGREALALLDAAKTHFEDALIARDRRTMPADWANTKNALGNVTFARALRTSGPEAKLLAEEAIAYFLQALTVRTRDDLPFKWAATTANLANARSWLAKNLPPGEAYRVLGETETIYRDLATVLTRESRPFDWALLQKKRGVVLVDQSSYAYDVAGSDQAVVLLEKALAAYGEALGIFTKSELPVEWAGMQRVISNALREKAISSEGAATKVLLGQSIAGLREALAILTYQEMPAEWIYTRVNLGRSLHSLGLRTEGNEGMKLLEEAVDAYRWAGLEGVSDWPLDMARSHNEMGLVQYDIAMRGEVFERWLSLLNAEINFRAAVTSYDNQNLPIDAVWASANSNLGTILWERSRRKGETESVKLLEESAEAFRKALEYQTDAGNAPEQARINFQLGRTLIAHAEKIEGQQQVKLLQRSMEYMREAQVFYTRQTAPYDWLDIQLYIAMGQNLLGDAQSGSAIKRHWEDSVRSFRAAIDHADKNAWPETSANLREMLTEVEAKLNQSN